MARSRDRKARRSVSKVWTIASEEGQGVDRVNVKPLGGEVSARGLQEKEERYFVSLAQHDVPSKGERW